MLARAQLQAQLPMIGFGNVLGSSLWMMLPPPVAMKQACTTFLVTTALEKMSVEIDQEPPSLSFQLNSRQQLSCPTWLLQPLVEIGCTEFHTTVESMTSNLM